MYQKIRRADREMTTAEARELLQSGEYGILSTVGADGMPYGVPMNYATIDNTLYFHCAKGVGHRIDNLRGCRKVCFTVVGKTEVLPEKFSTNYESVVVFGTARDAGEDKLRGLEAIIEKYAPDYKLAGQSYIREAIDKTGVIAVDIEYVTGKARR